MAYSIPSRLGNLEGDMEAVYREINDIKIDITKLQDIVTKNATQITKLSDYMNNDVKEKSARKKELSKIGVIILSFVLSIISSVTVAVIVSELIK